MTATAPAPRKLTTEQGAAIAADLAAGLSTAAIIHKHGCTRHAVRYQRNRKARLAKERLSRAERRAKLGIPKDRHAYHWTPARHAAYLADIQETLLESRVWTLHETGVSIAEIARLTGRTIADVEQIAARCPVGWIGTTAREGGRRGMTTNELNALRRWAESFGPSTFDAEVQYRCGTILKLLDDHARLAALVQSLSERCHKQSELLTKKAEAESRLITDEWLESQIPRHSEEWWLNLELFVVSDTHGHTLYHASRGDPLMLVTLRDRQHFLDICKHLGIALPETKTPA